MKNLFLISTLVLLIAAPSFAISTVTFTDSYGNTGGGEFIAGLGSGWSKTPYSLPGENDNGFETFCVEKNEYIDFGTEYFVKISTAAVMGGVGGQDNPPGDPSSDSLDSMTAYLYEKFITRSLSGYVYDKVDGSWDDRISSANALQHVIWHIEGEESKTWSAGSLEELFYQDALANNTGEIGDVRIMNVFGDEDLTVNLQDQLVMLTMPAPGAVLLGSIGVVLVGWLRRRKTL